jgi:hypothetical protein
VDNCAVDILRQDGKPKFNKKNYIRIVSPAGNLFPDAATSGGTTSKNAGDTCYIKFLYVALSLSRARRLFAYVQLFAAADNSWLSAMARISSSGTTHSSQPLR